MRLFCPIYLSAEAVPPAGVQVALQPAMLPRQSRTSHPGPHPRPPPFSGNTCIRGDVCVCVHFWVCGRERAQRRA